MSYSGESAEGAEHLPPNEGVCQSSECMVVDGGWSQLEGGAPRNFVVEASVGGWLLYSKGEEQR